MRTNNMHLRATILRSILPLIALPGLLGACGGDRATAPMSPTGTPGASNGPTPSLTSAETSLSGINLSKVDPCALLKRDEAEAIMGPLDWKLVPASDNDPKFMVSCYFDEWGRGDTPEKSLVVRVMAPDIVVASFGGDLDGQGISLIPRQDVGLESEPAVRYDETHFVALALPECKGGLPCVIAGEGSEWFRLMVIMPDRSALRVEIDPQNVDYAKEFARKILARLPID